MDVEVDVYLAMGVHWGCWDVCVRRCGCVLRVLRWMYT